MTAITGLVFLLPAKPEMWWEYKSAGRPRFR
jgi:hypothetical protein